MTQARERRDAIAGALRCLAALYRAPPREPALAPILVALRDGELIAQWPFGSPPERDKAAAQIRLGLERDDLTSAYRRLFEGPNELRAPPWGSVYLDHEGVLFGRSTTALRRFLRAIGARPMLEINEPEDHIGLMLHLLADLVAANRMAEAAEALTEHMLPWSGRYLDALESEADHPFYEALAVLTALTIAGLAQEVGATAPAPAPSVRS